MVLDAALNGQGNQFAISNALSNSLFDAASAKDVARSYQSTSFLRDGDLTTQSAVNDGFAQARIARLNDAVSSMSTAISSLRASSSVATESEGILNALKGRLQANRDDFARTSTQQTTSTPITNTPTTSVEGNVAGLTSSTQLTSLSGVSSGDTLSFTRGDTATRSLQVNDNTTVGDVLNFLEEDADIEASLDEDGQINITSETGQSLSLDSGDSNLISALGFAGNTQTTRVIEGTPAQAAVATGQVDLNELGNVGRLAGFEEGASFEIRLDGAQSGTTVTLDASDTGQNVVDKINEVAGVRASIDAGGRLNIQARDGAQLELVDGETGSLRALGFQSNATTTITGADQTVTDNAVISAATNVRDAGTLSHVRGLEDGEQISVRVGERAETTVTVRSAQTAQGFVDELNAIDGVTAGFNDDGSVRIEAQNGETLELRNASGDALNDLGISLNAQESTDVTRQEATSATATGSAQLDALTPLALTNPDLNQSSFSVTVNGQTSSVTISETTTRDSLVNNINAIDGVSASVDDQGRLSITTDEATSLELRNVTGDALGGLGFATNATEDITVQSEVTVNAVAVGNRALTEDTRLSDLGIRDSRSGINFLFENSGRTRVRVGDAETVGDYINKINAVDGLSAGLDDNGNLRIEATNGEGLTLDSFRQSVVGNLGLTEDGTYASSTQTFETTQTVGFVRQNPGTRDVTETVTTNFARDEADQRTIPGQQITVSSLQIAPTTAVADSIVTESRFVADAGTQRVTDGSLEQSAPTGLAAIRADSNSDIERSLGRLQDSVIDGRFDGAGLVNGEVLSVATGEETSRSVLGGGFGLDALGLGQIGSISTLEDFDNAIASISSALETIGLQKGNFNREIDRIGAQQIIANNRIDQLEFGLSQRDEEAPAVNAQALTANLRSLLSDYAQSISGSNVALLRQF